MVRMYGEESLATQHKQQVSLVQVLMAIVIVMTTFVIPAQLIDLQRQQGDITKAYNLSVVAEKSEQVQSDTTAEVTSTPQVAGVSTTASPARIIQIPGTSIRINMDSEIGMLMVIGMMLIAVALGLSVYLLATAGLPHPQH